MKIELIFLCLYIQYGSSLYCYWNTGCPYKYLGSKTAYSAIRGDIRDSNIKLTGCEPVSIWGLVRHGKSSPRSYPAIYMRNALVIRDAILSSYDKGNSSLCAQDIDNLRQWKLDNKTLDGTYSLTEEGAQDLQGIGSRLKQAFPKLLENLDRENYTFRSAHEHWVIDSAKAFVSGIQSQGLVIDKVKDGFDIMNPYRGCLVYTKDVLDNPKTYTEKDKFRKSPEYLAMKDRIQRRSGIDFILSNQNITALYNWCRYGWSGIDNKLSPWCAIFTTEDLKALEFSVDVKRYYKDGPGTPMNRLFGNIPLADLLKKFQEVKDGKGKKIVAYLTHATLMEMVYTSLNIFKDDSHLSGASINPQRKWRTSKFSPFSANLLAVLSRCNQEDDYNVVFYLNEEPLLSICKDGVCTWQEFEDKLKEFSTAKPDFC